MIRFTYIESVIIIIMLTFDSASVIIYSLIRLGRVLMLSSFMKNSMFILIQKLIKE